MVSFVSTFGLCLFPRDFHEAPLVLSAPFRPLKGKDTRRPTYRRTRGALFWVLPAGLAASLGLLIKAKKIIKI